jgi:hypothetical protein
VPLTHPHAVHVPYFSAGPLDAGHRPKGVLHTTEGSSLPHYSGSAPHITFDPTSGRLWQHMPVGVCALALEHHTVPTNHIVDVQIELIAFAGGKPAGSQAKTVAEWGDREYRNVARLMRWCEHATGIPRLSTVKFGDSGAAAHDRLRMSPAEWRSYSGWCGHQHVPEQFAGHWDPGAIDIKRLLAGSVATGDWPGVYLQLGDHGVDVKRAKLWLEQVRDPTKAGQPRLARDDVFGHDMLIRTRQFQRHHRLDADGIIGPATWEALARESDHAKRTRKG